MSIRPGDLSPQEKWNRLSYAKGNFGQTLSGIIRVVVSPAANSPLKGPCVSLSVMVNSLQPLGLQPSRLLCPWNSPGKNTGVGCQFLLQGIFQILGSGRSSSNVRYPHSIPGLGRYTSRSVRISVMFIPNWWLSLLYQDYFLKKSLSLPWLWKPSICHYPKILISNSDTIPILIVHQKYTSNSLFDIST